MKRAGVLVLVAVLALGVAGCSPAPARPAGSLKPPASSTPAAPAVADPYAAIAVDGAHEAAAVAALPAALSTVAKAVKQAGKTPTDVTAGKATLVAYVVQARDGDRTTLFEVRADGKPYPLYAYPAASDPAKLLWTSAAVGEGAYLADPAGPTEIAAADAVRAVVTKVPPKGEVKVTIYGYIFYWIGSDGQPLKVAGGSPFSVTIDPKGNAGSWSL